MAADAVMGRIASYLGPERHYQGKRTKVQLPEPN